MLVAHRIRTVIDYDRLLVLDKGKVSGVNLEILFLFYFEMNCCHECSLIIAMKVVEFDTPWNLIQKEDGVFRGMCLKTGTFGELEAVAKAKTFSA